MKDHITFTKDYPKKTRGRTGFIVECPNCKSFIRVFHFRWNKMKCPNYRSGSTHHRHYGCGKEAVRSAWKRIHSNIYVNWSPNWEVSR